MTGPRAVKIFKILRILLFAALLAGCPSNPAAPPAPPAEIPSALRFPRSVSINVDTVRSESGLALKTFVGAGGPLSDEIALGPDRVQETNELVEGFLGLLNQLEIPVSTLTTTFAGGVPGDPGVIKIDFANFDADVNGADDGCSGHTAALPICYRIWVDHGDGVFERLIAGRFDTFPTEVTAGLGLFRVRELEPEPKFIGVIYDHRDPQAKSTEQFTLFLPEEPLVLPEEISSLEDVSAHLSHHDLATQEGTDQSGIKTVKVSTDAGPGDLFQYAGRWQEGGDFWSGLLDVEGGFESDRVFDLSNPTCAQISTGGQVSRSECLPLGIDVEGEGFIGFTTLEDVRFSSSFRETPTF